MWFSHMFAWLETVLQSVHAHPETLFVIRAHPDELRRAKKVQKAGRLGDEPACSGYPQCAFYQCA